MKKINLVFQIFSLFSSIFASIISFINGNISESIAWGYGAFWIINILITERNLKVTEEINEVLRAEIELLK